MRIIGKSEYEMAMMRARFGRGQVFTVKETIVDESGRVLYALNEISGEHNARLFPDTTVMHNHYGILINRDEQVWLVPLVTDANAVDNPRVQGQALRISQEVGRSGRYFLGGQPEEAFARIEGDPASGEFVVSALPGGDYRLEGIPWQSGVSGVEIALAEGAIAEVVGLTPRIG